MNKRQARIVERIRAYVEKHDLMGHPEAYEIKKFDVSMLEPTGVVAVYTVTGRIGDDGTMAAVMCRRSRQIYIGPRGGVRGYDNGRLKTGFYDVMALCYT